MVKFVNGAAFQPQLRPPEVISAAAAAYHLGFREQKGELEVRINNKCLEVQRTTKYLSVRLDDTVLQTTPLRSQGQGDI